MAPAAAAVCLPRVTELILTHLPAEQKLPEPGMLMLQASVIVHPHLLEVGGVMFWVTAMLSQESPFPRKKTLTWAALHDVSDMTRVF